MAAARRRSSSVQAVRLADLLTIAGLDPDRARRLEEMKYEVASASARKWFREPGTPRREVMFVAAGLLSKQKVAIGGARQIIALRFPGEVILPRIGPAPYGLEPLTKSQLFIGDGPELLQIANADADLLRVLWAVIQRNEAIAHEWLVNRGRRSGAARVIHLLLETRVRSGVESEQQVFRNPFKQEHIAQITGQTAVNVSKVLAELARSKLIERKGREIRFTQLAELSRLAEFDPTYLRYPTA